MKARKIMIISLLLVILQGASVSAAALNHDYCRFKGDDGQVYLELYLSIARHVLVHKADSAGWYGAVLFNVQIFSDSVLQAEDRWHIADLADKPEDIDSLQKLVDIRIYMLESGRYDFRILATDSLSRHPWSDNFQVDIAEFPTGKLTMSDIQIAGYFLPERIIEKYDRGGFSMIPSADRIFGISRPYFFYYVEVYSPEGKGTTDYQLNRYILSGAKDTVLTLSEKVYTIDKAFMDIDSVSLENLPGDTYSFVVQAVDSEGKTVTRDKRFFIFRSDLEYSQMTATIEYDSLKAAQELEEIELFLNRKVYKRISKLSAAQKSAFVESFWREFEVDTSRPSRAEFKKRVEQANEKWTNLTQKGSKTDRGRIFQLYGEPDYREDHPLDISTKSYVIWNYYQIDGGVYFVFVDRNGQGEYNLVHSTKHGEIDQPDWFEEFVARSGVGSRP